MQTFSYVMKNLEGRKFKGAIRAKSNSDAIEKLKDPSSVLISLKKLSLIQKLDKGLRFKSSELISFFRELGQLNVAGISLIDSLALVNNESNKASLFPVVKLIESGVSLSQALIDSGVVKDDLIAVFIRNAESHGDYSKAFTEIVEHLAWRNNLWSRLKKAVSYPAFILMFGLGMISFLLSFVVPKLLDLYITTGLEVPASTRALLFVADYGGYISLLMLSPLLFLLVLYLGLMRYAEVYPNIITSVHNTISKYFPYLAARMQEVIMLQYLENIAVLLQSRKAAIIDSMRHAEVNVSPRFFRPIFVKVRGDVKAGQSLSASLKKYNLVSYKVFKMLEVGEKSGNMDASLKHIVLYLNEGICSRIDSFVQKLAPAMLLIVGGLLLFVISSVFLPLYDSLGEIS